MNCAHAASIPVMFGGASGIRLAVQFLHSPQMKNNARLCQNCGRPANYTRSKAGNSPGAMTTTSAAASGKSVWKLSAPESSRRDAAAGEGPQNVADGEVLHQIRRQARRRALLRHQKGGKPKEEKGARHR